MVFYDESTAIFFYSWVILILLQFFHHSLKLFEPKGFSIPSPLRARRLLKMLKHRIRIWPESLACSDLLVSIRVQKSSTPRDNGVHSTQCLSSGCPPRPQTNILSEGHKSTRDVKLGVYKMKVIKIQLLRYADFLRW